MLDRNRRIKARPERFQDCKESFDLVITAEERVYDQVIECKNFQYSAELLFDYDYCTTTCLKLFESCYRRVSLLDTLVPVFGAKPFPLTTPFS